MKMFDDFMDFLAMNILGRWLVRAVVISAVAMAVLTSVGIAQAAPQCDQRARALDHLAQKYKEAPVAIGVTSSGGIVEVLTTSDGATWTIIISYPTGTSCLVVAGENWRLLTPVRDTGI